MKKHEALNLPSMTGNILEYFYPKKHEILSMFSRPPMRNFLVVFPNPQLKSKSQRQCTFVTAAKVPLATQWFWVQLYEALHGDATTHKTSEMTHMQVNNFQCKHKLALKFKGKIKNLWNTRKLSNCKQGEMKGTEVWQKSSKSAVKW